MSLGFGAVTPEKFEFEVLGFLGWTFRDCARSECVLWRRDPGEHDEQVELCRVVLARVAGHVILVRGMRKMMFP